MRANLAGTIITTLALASNAIAGVGEPPRFAPGAPTAPAQEAAKGQSGAAPTAAYTWDGITLDASANVGLMLSAASDGGGVPHVSYYSTANGGDLKYATFDGSSWTTETLLGTADDEGNATSIAVALAPDPRTSPLHIVHHNQTTSTWHHSARSNGGSWWHGVIETLGTPGTFGRDSGAGVFGDVDVAKLYAAYPDPDGDGLRFAEANVEAPPPYTGLISSHEGGVDVYDIELLVDPSNGDAHLAYVDQANFDLHYAVRTAGGLWLSQVAQADLLCAGCTISIALDSQGRPHITYSRFHDGIVSLAHTWLDGTWQVEDLDTGTFGNEFVNVSLQVDDFDNLHLTYQQNATEELIYGNNADGGTWSFETVTTMNSTSLPVQHNALILNGSCPGIVRHDPVSLTLEYESPVGGSVLTVPGDHATIREAVSWACPGDTVQVADGSYTETARILFDGKSVCLMSENGPDATVLDLSENRLEIGGRATISSALIDGFTIHRGDVNSGNAYYDGLDLVVRSCVISGSDQTAVRVQGSGTSTTLVECTISGNDGPFWNLAGGVVVAGANALLDRCVIWGNCSDGSAGTRSEITPFGPANVEIRDCVVNSSGVSGVDGGVVVYTGDNVFTDPLFCDPISCTSAPTTAGIYTVSSCSPALAPNHPSGQQRGALGWGCGTNLLINPGAEDGTTGWTAVIPPIESLASGECGGPAPRTGNQLFAVGGICAPGVSYAEARQSVDVSPLAAIIDGGLELAEYSGYLRAFGSNDDIPSLWIVFKDSSDLEIGSSDTLLTGTPAWTLLSGLVGIPVGTRTIDFYISGTRNFGSDNDSYFDDLSLTVSTCEETAADVPTEPTTEPPTEFALHRSFPNPSGLETTIEYDLPQPAPVELRVFDVSGRLVRILESRVKAAGRHSSDWDGTDDSGAPAGAGVYFYRLEAQDFRATRKLLRLR